MAKNIDELVIQIKADTKQLQAELRQINGKIKLSGAAGGAAFGGMAAGLSKVKVGAAAALVGIYALGKGISAVAEVGSGFEDLKDSLDQVFGSIAAGDVAMQKVMTFAQTTPFQIETATKAFIALKSAGIEPSMKMLQTFADTATVSVDSLGTFEALVRMVQRGAAGGMGMEELTMISDKGIDVLGILKEKLNLTKDDIAKFGKTAEGAAKMVKALTDGIEEKYGGAMAAQMDNLSVKTSNMIIAFKTLADDVFKSGLGDFLKETADYLTKIANAAGEIVRKVTGRATLEDITGDAKIAEKTPEFRLAILRTHINEVQALVTQAWQNLQDLGPDAMLNIDLQQYILDYRADIEKSMKELRNLGVLQDAILAEMDAGGGETKTKEFIAGDIEGLIEFQAKWNKLVQDAIPEYKKLGDQIDYIKGLMETGDEQELAGIMGFLGVKDLSEMQAVIDHLQKLQDELGETATFSSEMQTAIISASQAFTSDFVSALMDGENALDSFKNFAKNIVNQIITIFLQMAVVNEILNHVFSLTGTNNALPTRSNTKPVEGAGGGSAYQGQAMWVGERGPELFVPHSNGNIMNNMNSKNAMGGGATVINQSINFATGIVPTVRAEVMQMMPQIAEVTKGAVAEAAMRGGNYRRALQGG